MGAHGASKAPGSGFRDAKVRERSKHRQMERGRQTLTRNSQDPGRGEHLLPLLGAQCPVTREGGARSDWRGRETGVSHQTGAGAPVFVATFS